MQIVLKVFIACLIVLAASLSHGGPALSASRFPGESSQAARLRHGAYDSDGIHFELSPTAYDKRISSAQLFSALDTLNIPRWESKEVLKERFVKVRDTRFLKETDRPEFLRRSSWLYPDDGCYSRAALAIKNLEEWKVPNAPKKVFIFGDLVAKTPNSPNGSVSWWYHVVPIVQVGDAAYVIDPAVDASTPLELHQWIQKLGGSEDIELAICDSNSYDPDSACEGASPNWNIALRDQLFFLPYEAERLKEMQRDPEKELGENPPWLHPKSEMPCGNCL